MKVIFLLLALIAASTAAPQNGALQFVGGRIVGGSNAAVNEFPHQCSIQWVILTRSQHVCGCSILNNRWILTAAHCLTESSDRGRLEILAGVLDITQTPSTAQRSRIATTVIHPQYTGGVGPHDIALISLASPFTFTDAVKPVNLPVAGSIPSGSTTLSGWGSTSTSIIPTQPSILQKVVTDLVPFDTCSAALGPSPIESSNICTGPLTGGVSACSGDSGGPLVQISGGVTTQVGIVSWGMFPCGRPNSPSVYGRVSFYIDWINKNMT